MKAAEKRSRPIGPKDSNMTTANNGMIRPPRATIKGHLMILTLLSKSMASPHLEEHQPQRLEDIVVPAPCRAHRRALNSPSRQPATARCAGLRGGAGRTRTNH